MASFPSAAYRSATLQAWEAAKGQQTVRSNCALRVRELTVCETGDHAAGRQRLVVDIAVVHALLSHVSREHPTVLQ